MGCCLPKSFTTKRDIEQSFILLQDSDKLQESPMPETFDINRGLVMFGQDKHQKNFMLTFNFASRSFNQIRLQKKGKLTSRH